MTKSMTAFARVQSGNITWEIRSVNHRYLDGTFKMPENYRGLEPGLRNNLRTEVDRGKIDCLLRVEEDSKNELNLVINENQLRQLKEAIDATAVVIDNLAPLNALEVLKWPGILSSASIDQTEIEKEVSECFKQALFSLLEMRSREGNELKRIILEKLRELQNIVDEARKEAPIISKRQHEKLIKRLSELNQEADNNRLEQELVYLAQKSDIAEELDRLDTHVEEVQTTLAKSGPVGRRLDFLMQELNREANTLSSKAQAANTSIQAVELKVIIEQMREQVQNIE
ncbi:MAG: hypothetical protein ACI9FB_002480 [Candidatus Azotimanducaceae bacterium]|jgi:uncharacterized protein (TIGR00255 family)